MALARRPSSASRADRLRSRGAVHEGHARAPQCGFSARVVQMLDGHLPEYTTVDVLADAAIRQGIKDFSSWPTIPQLYVDGEFVGGCDIVTEMFQSGELQTLLGDSRR